MDNINIREYQAPNTANPQARPIKYFTNTNQPPPEGAQLVKEIPPMQTDAADPFAVRRQSVVDKIGFDPDTYDPMSEAQREINMGLGRKMMIHTFGKELEPNQMTEQQQLLFRKNMSQLKSDLLKKHTATALRGAMALKNEMNYFQKQQEEVTKRFSAEMKAAAKTGKPDKEKERKETDIMSAIKYLKGEYSGSDMFGNMLYNRPGSAEAYNVAANKFLELLDQNPDMGEVKAAREAHNFVVDQENKYRNAIKMSPDQQKNIDAMFKSKYGYVPNYMSSEAVDNTKPGSND